MGNVLLFGTHHLFRPFKDIASGGVSHRRDQPRSHSDVARKKEAFLTHRQRKIPPTKEDWKPQGLSDTVPVTEQTEERISVFLVRSTMPLFMRHRETWCSARRGGDMAFAPKSDEPTPRTMSASAGSKH